MSISLYNNNCYVWHDMNNMLTCQLFEKKDLQFKMIVVAKWAGRIQIIMIVSAHCHGEWGDVITLPTSNSRGNVDKMWQCNKVGDGELGNIITSPTPKTIGNIRHWIWRWKYQHFWHDVAVHLYRKWWIGQYYYIAHCKNHRKYRALNLEMKIPTFLTWCGSAFI